MCGEGEGVAGDCVVPLSSALLPGARHVVLDGVFHSMSRIGTFDEESGEEGENRVQVKREQVSYVFELLFDDSVPKRVPASVSFNLWTQQAHAHVHAHARA